MVTVEMVFSNLRSGFDEILVSVASKAATCEHRIISSRTRQRDTIAYSPLATFMNGVSPQLPCSYQQAWVWTDVNGSAAETTLYGTNMLEV